LERKPKTRKGNSIGLEKVRPSTGSNRRKQSKKPLAVKTKDWVGGQWQELSNAGSMVREKRGGENPKLGDNTTQLKGKKLARTKQDKRGRVL